MEGERANIELRKARTGETEGEEDRKERERMIITNKTEKRQK